MPEPYKVILNVSWYIPYRPDGTKTPDPEWPDNWPIPRLGENVKLKDGRMFVVSAIDWFPQGEDDPEPFVHIVLSSY